MAMLVITISGKHHDCFTCEVGCFFQRSIVASKKSVEPALRDILASGNDSQFAIENGHRNS